MPKKNLIGLVLESGDPCRCACIVSKTSNFVLVWEIRLLRGGGLDHLAISQGMADTCVTIKPVSFHILEQSTSWAFIVSRNHTRPTLTTRLRCSSDDPNHKVWCSILTYTQLYLCLPLGDLELHRAALRVLQWFVTCLLAEGMYLLCYNKWMINSCHSDNETLKSLSTTESNASLGTSFLQSIHGGVLKIEAQEPPSLKNTNTLWRKTFKKNNVLIEKCKKKYGKDSVQVSHCKKKLNIFTESIFPIFFKIQLKAAAFYC